MSEIKLKSIKIPGVAKKQKEVDAIGKLSKEVKQWIHLQKEGSDLVAMGNPEGIEQFEKILKDNKIKFDAKK